MKLKGKDIVYTYQFRGRYGNLTLNSKSVQDPDTLIPLNKDNDANNRSFQVTNPEFLSPINRGFGLDRAERPIGYRGKLVLPPCSETRITKVDGEKRIQCLYSYSKNPDETIILTNKYDIDHDIKRSQCTLWGAGYKGENVKKLMERDNDVSYTSLNEDGTFEPPVFMFCTK